jgi:arabinogalactan endo-1,4-beta-galactosidase
MTASTFRTSLCVSSYARDFPADGTVYTDGHRVARTWTELQDLFVAHGGNEIYFRLNTQKTSTKRVGGVALEDAMDFLHLAAARDLPVNPEVMCVGDYMDFMRQDAPDFDEWPELDLPSKPWSEYTLDEMCGALEAYGEAVARRILSTGCRVNVWDLGNETNFGFAGVNLGLSTVVNPKLARTHMMSVMAQPGFGAAWLEKNIWRFNAEMFAAVASGIRKSDPAAVFSCHISTVTASPNYAARYFTTMTAHGFDLAEAGVSFYPSAPGPFRDPMARFQKLVTRVREECGIPVFVSEYGYPSAKLARDAEFSSWSKPAPGYPLTPSGQEAFATDVVQWGAENGLSGIRPLAPDFLGGWEPMSLFEYDPSSRTATSKPALAAFAPNTIASDQ